MKELTKDFDEYKVKITFGVILKHSIFSSELNVLKTYLNKKNTI